MRSVGLSNGNKGGDGKPPFLNDSIRQGRYRYARSKPRDDHKRLSESAKVEKGKIVGLKEEGGLQKERQDRESKGRHVMASPLWKIRSQSRSAQSWKR